MRKNRSMRKLKILFLLCVLPGFILAQSHFQKAQNFLEQRDYKAAKVEFQKVLENNPGNKKAIEGLGDTAVFQENWDEALVHYKKLVTEEPNNANYNFKYGGALGLKAKNISRIKALFYISDIKKYLKKAAKLDPQHIETRWALCELYLELPGILGGSNSTAEKYADQLLKINPLNGYLTKARVAEQEGNRDKEKKYYEKALKEDYSGECGQKLKAIGHKNNHLPKDIDQKIGNTCKIFSKNYLNYQIGKACAETGLQNWRGILYMKRYILGYTAIDGVPPKWSYWRMAELYKNLGIKSEAKYWIEKSLAIDGDFDKAKDERDKIEKM